MPINYKNYGPEWPEIRKRILDREGHRCKQCGGSNYEVISRMQVGHVCFGRYKTYKEARRAAEGLNVTNEDMEEPAYIVIVLTIAHLNHNVNDNTEQNLAALCQRCHLRHDKVLHRMNAKATWRKKKDANQGHLFGQAQDLPLA